MKQNAVSDWARREKFNLEKLEIFKNLINVGSQVAFHWTGIEGNTKTQKIKGTVVEKYPNIFRLDSGKTFRYVDYMLGYIYLR